MLRHQSCLLIGVLIAGLTASAALAEKLPLCLVAADRAGKPLCSTPTDYRYSPFGGLIATEWLSGVTLNEDDLFPCHDILGRASQPDEIQIDGGAALDDDEEGLDQAVQAREADVDPLYRGKVYTKLKELREIGPRTVRYSRETVSLAAKNVLQPGDIAVSRQPGPGTEHVRFLADRVEVDCYPVRISAVRQGADTRRVPFHPDLRWGARDLLAEVRCEHSPALPAGPPNDVLDGNGRISLFYDLTIYLLPTVHAGGRSQTPYTLNGAAFHVGKDGVILLNELGVLRKTGPFSLQLVLPAAADDATVDSLPVYLDGGAGVAFDVTRSKGRPTAEPSPVKMLVKRNAASVTVQYPGDAAAKPIRFQAPAPQQFPNAMAVCKAAARPEGESTVYVFAAPPSLAAQHGAWRFTASVWTADGPQPAPPAIAVRLEPFPALQPRRNEIRRATAAADGLYTVEVKDLPAGLYRVRFPELLSETAPYDYFVCLTNPGVRGAVSLFTYHNRCDYRQGEMIEVTAALRATEAVDNLRGELTLQDDQGRETPLGTLTFRAPKGGSDARSITIPAAQLQPGRYQLTLKTANGELLCHRMTVQIFPAELATTWEGFATTICETGPFRTPEGICSYQTMLNSPTETLRASEETARYTGQITVPVELLPLCRQDPLFPVAETTERYTDTERTMAAALRFGVQHLPHGVWGMDGQTANWNPLHSYPESLDWMRRMYAQRAQLYREFASFGGFFMNWYPGLSPHYEMHPPAAGFAEYQATALQQAINDAMGPLPKGWAWSQKNGLYYTQPDGTIVKQGDMLAAGTTHPMFNAPAMQELVEWEVRGQRRRTQAFSQAYDAWTTVCRTLGQWNYLSFVPVSWFRGPNYYPPIYFASSPRAGIHAYTDWQADPYQELFGIDYYNAGSGKPPWVQMFSGGRGMQLRQTFLAAGRGAWGVGCNTGFFPQGRAGEETRLITEQMHRYGPYFQSLRPVSEVAIVRSLRQETADTGPFQGSGGRNGMVWFEGLQGEQYALYYNLLRAGYPAAFITEEEIAAGGLARYKAVFLVRQRLVMPPALMKQFTDYAAGGGKVIKDAFTAAQYPGEVVNLGPDEAIQPNVGSSSHVIGGRYLWLLYNYLRCRSRLDAVLAKLPRPRVRPDQYQIVQATLAGHDTAAVFAINDTMVPPAVHTAEHWFIQNVALARKGTLVFDKPYYVYDVTEGGRETRLTQPAAGQPGAFAYPVEFLRSEGRILVVTARPIRDLRLKAQWLAREEGDGLQVEVAVLDDQGASFRDALPVELILQDPQGREVKRIFRAAGPGAPVTLALGRNLAPGAWKLLARELVTGREATVTFEVKQDRPIRSLLFGDGKVLVRRPDELRRFLADKPAVTLVLDEGQPAAYRQAAEGLAVMLRRAGKRCEILQIDPLAVLDLPLRWRRNAYDTRVWERVTRGEAVAVRRGLTTLSGTDYAYYDHPASGYAQPGAQFALYRDVILIGAPRDNRLIADLHGALNRPASAAALGPGGALLQVTWDGFAPRCDALTLQVEDADGILAGSAVLEALLAPKPAAPPATVIATAESAGGAPVRPLPNVQRDGFGTPVNIVPLDGGRKLLASFGDSFASGSAEYLLDDRGTVVAQYPDIIGGLTPLGADRFLQRWREMIILRDGTMQPLWRLTGENAGSMLVQPDTRDMFLVDGNQILRLDREAHTRWVVTFDADILKAADFIHPWRVTVQAVSPDGKRLLVAGYHEVMYGATVAGYDNPAVAMLDVATGAVLWRKPGLLVRGTACAFAGDRIIVCTSGEYPPLPHPSLVILDAAGAVVQTITLTEKIAGLQPIGRGDLALVRKADSAGVSLFDLRAGDERVFPVPGTVKSVWVLGDQVAIATWDKVVFCFDAAMQPLRTIRLEAQASAVARDGQGLLIGTDSGQVLWTDAQGAITRTVDLTPYNYTEDEDAWARRWLGLTIAGVPELRITPFVGTPVSMLDRARKNADVAENPLTNADFERGAQGWTVTGKAEARADGVVGKALALTGSLSQEFPCTPGATYLLSLYQQAGDSEGGITVTVDFKGRNTPFQVVFPLSQSWEERTAAFRAPEGATGAVITLAPRRTVNNTPEAITGFLDHLVLGAVQFRTGNLLRGDAAPEDEESPDQPRTPMAVTTIKRTIPWVNFRAVASGASAQPPRITMPSAWLVDGRLTGHESSWTGTPVPQGIFSDHVEMTITFETPQTLNMVALYEDPASPQRYTRRFAVFAQTKAGLKLLGACENNRNPFNLFTFDTVTAEGLLYYWTGSADGHVRLMEIEAYGKD